jgi:hypothetical protein
MLKQKKKNLDPLPAKTQNINTFLQKNILRPLTTPNLWKIFIRKIKKSKTNKKEEFDLKVLNYTDFLNKKNVQEDIKDD